jgi:hypothetical protein
LSLSHIPDLSHSRSRALSLNHILELSPSRSRCLFLVSVIYHLIIPYVRLCYAEHSYKEDPLDLCITTSCISLISDPVASLKCHSDCITCSFKFVGHGFRVIAFNFECNFSVFVVYEIKH